MSIHAIYGAISPRFRRRRMRQFITAIAPLPSERILDVGGTAAFWSALTAAGVLQPQQITVLNVDRNLESDTRAAGMEFICADACALPFGDAVFPIAFSNSAIEHVGSWDRQLAFAAELRRVARRAWIQTPAREFFIEPHLVAPFIHWLPPRLQCRLIRFFTIRGWLERPDRAAVDAFLKEVRLLTFDEVQSLFPDCTITRERFLGLTKSYVAIRR